jgi:hypothetical protein
MIKYPVTRSIIQQATTIANRIPSNINKSIRSGEGRLAGAIGEAILLRITDGISSGDDWANYDVLWNNIKYDVKTKECTSPPQPHYFASIAVHNPNQKCDRYAFFRVMRRKDEDYTQAWLMGWMGKEEYFDNAVFYRKGQVDPSSTFGWTFRESCYNVPYSLLHDFKKECELV